MRVLPTSSGFEELITTSQQGPYRQWYIRDVHVTQSVKFMQMHAVMNVAVGYDPLCFTALVLLLVNPIFHVQTSIYTRPILALYSDKHGFFWFHAFSSHFLSVFWSGSYMIPSYNIFKWYKWLILGAWCHLWKWHIFTLIISSDIGLWRKHYPTPCRHKPRILSIVIFYHYCSISDEMDSVICEKRWGTPLVLN